jgi:hypothetical protein
MNYIKRLQADNAEKDGRIAAMEAELSAFRAHLALPKFNGVEDGERKDWIATADVTAWIDRIGDAEPPPHVPSPCGQCGESDRENGNHGIGRCVSF